MILNIFQFLGQANDVTTYRDATKQALQVRVDWSTGLDIIALILTFFSLILYSAYVFKFGRS